MKIVLKSAWKNILPQKLADSVYEQKKKKNRFFCPGPAEYKS